MQWPVHTTLSPPPESVPKISFLPLLQLQVAGLSACSTITWVSSPPLKSFSSFILYYWPRQQRRYRSIPLSKCAVVTDQQSWYGLSIRIVESNLKVDTLDMIPPKFGSNGKEKSTTLMPLLRAATWFEFTLMLGIINALWWHFRANSSLGYGIFIPAAYRWGFDLSASF